LRLKTHFKSKLKSLALNVDFNGPSTDRLGSKRPAHENIKYKQFQLMLTKRAKAYNSFGLVV